MAGKTGTKNTVADTGFLRRTRRSIALPALRPQLRRSEIEKRIALLQTQNIDHYHENRTWLDEHRFYLTVAQCDVVNSELSRILSAPQEVGEIRLPIARFVPDPGMHNGYYLPEGEA